MSECHPHQEFHFPAGPCFTGFSDVFDHLVDQERPPKARWGLGGPFAAGSIRCNQRSVPMTSVDERRRHSRVPVDWPVVLRTEDRTAVGEARNVSARGALIQTERPLHPKEKFRVFMVPANRRAFRVTCEVAWVKGRPSGRRISTYVSGIRFTRLLKGDGQFLLDFIRTQLMPHSEVPRRMANL